MREFVSIKSSKYGLEVHLNAEIPFEMLLEAVRKKFTETAKFFSNSQVAASFEGRMLSKIEEQILIQTITEVANIRILCVIDHNKSTEQMYRMIVEQCIEGIKTQDGQFYRGTLKRRQVLEAETSVVILGNVEKGAKVISKGNIVIMGALNGYAHAGASGNYNSFITALQMNPKILKIGEIEAKRHNFHSKDDITIEPKIALVDGEHIYIDPLT